MKMPIIPAAKSRSNWQFDLAAAQTFKKGSPVSHNASEEIAEIAADGTPILGFAAEAAGTDPESASKVLVAVAVEGRLFQAEGDNAPTMDDVNQSYGLAKDADGYWYVDGTDVANPRVYVHNVDLERNLYIISVLAAHRQAAP